MHAISSPEVFEIEGADGGPLRVDVYAPGGTGAPECRHSPIVLVHGFRGYKNWGFIPFLAQRLAREGFVAVAYSASGSGIADSSGAFSEPERFRHNTYGRELNDLDRVVAWALERTAAAGVPDRRVGLIGHSRGGGIAFLHAAGDPHVGCVVTLGTMSRMGLWEPQRIAAWERGEEASVYDFRTRSHLPMSPDLWEDFRRNRERYDLAHAIESLRVPLLVVHGDEDRVVPLDHAREILSHRAAATAELRVIAGAGHTFQAGDRIRRTPPQLLEMVEAATAWMRRWLPWKD